MGGTGKRRALLLLPPDVEVILLCVCVFLAAAETLSESAGRRFA